MIPEDERDDDQFYGNSQEQGRKEKKEQKFVLLQSDQNTIETEKKMALQTLDDLKRLETDMDDLKSCYVDLKSLLNEQTEGIDQMYENTVTANENVEAAVTELQAVSKSSGGKCILS